jgi:hypothetical protein
MGSRQHKSGRVRPIHEDELACIDRACSGLERFELAKALTVCQVCRTFQTDEIRPRSKDTVRG